MKQCKEKDAKKHIPSDDYWYRKVGSILTLHSWHGFTENGPRWNIAQLWKLFSDITIRILTISFRNCVSYNNNNNNKRFNIVKIWYTLELFHIMGIKILGFSSKSTRPHSSLFKFQSTYKMWMNTCFTIHTNSRRPIYEFSKIGVIDILHG